MPYEDLEGSDSIALEGAYLGAIWNDPNANTTTLRFIDGRNISRMDVVYDCLLDMGPLSIKARTTILSESYWAAKSGERGAITPEQIRQKIGPVGDFMHGKIKQ